MLYIAASLPCLSQIWERQGPGIGEGAFVQAFDLTSEIYVTCPCNLPSR